MSSPGALSLLNRMCGNRTCLILATRPFLSCHQLPGRTPGVVQNAFDHINSAVPSVKVRAREHTDQSGCQHIIKLALEELISRPRRGVDRVRLVENIILENSLFVFSTLTAHSPPRAERPTPLRDKSDR